MNFFLKTLTALLLSLCILLISSCDDKDDVVEELVIQPSMTFFAFLKEYNSQLKTDIIIDVSKGDTVVAFIPSLKVDSLVASFDGNFVVVRVGDTEQVSNATINDFNNPVTYTIIDENGRIKQLTFLITGYNGLPKIDINTDGSSPIVSKQEYVSATVHIGNCPVYGVLDAPCGIKGRGNFSWAGYPKKPYHLKLNQKESVFGFPSNKDWILLAEYTDKSLLRTAFMFGFSEAVQMEWTPRYQFVELYINDDYQGVYILTEQVERAKGRVNVEDNGFIIEDDNHWSDEPLYFQTDLLRNYYTFKYPKSININVGDLKYKFISSFMNNLESELVKISMGKESHYYDYIDIECFAKWYIIMELTGNYDPNLFYTLATPNSLLKASPVWDAEWSLGLAVIDNRIERTWKLPPFLPQVESFVWKNEKMFSYLLQDRIFKNKLKELWSKYKSNIANVRWKIKSQAETLSYAQKDNFVKWPVLGQFYSAILVSFDNWEDETKYCISFFDKRFAWFDDYISKLE